MKKIWNWVILGPSLFTFFLLAGCASPAYSEVSAPPATTVPAPVQTASPTSSPSPTVFVPSPTVEPPTPTLALPSAIPTLAPADPVTPEIQATPATARSDEPAENGPIRHVVLISIDGLRPDALEQADTPILDGLRAKGAYSPTAQAVLPSVTLVNHASMLSGMSPEKHGIDWNEQDLDRGIVRGPTVFSVVHEAGLSTAMVVGKPKLDHLVLPGSVDSYIYAGFLDRQVLAEALGVIQTGLPGLLFIHLPDVDSAGHAAGWMSPAQLLMVNQTDQVVGELVEALQAGGYLEHTLLIITADHGGSDRRHGSAATVDTTVPWLAVGPGVPAGLTLAGQIMMYDTAATILYAFGLPIPQNWDGRPVMEIFAPVPIDSP